jgi:hypothetical protein
MVLFIITMVCAGLGMLLYFQPELITNHVFHWLFKD